MLSLLFRICKLISTVTCSAPHKFQLGPCVIFIAQIQEAHYSNTFLKVQGLLLFLVLQSTSRKNFDHFMQLLLVVVLCNILVLRPLHEEYFLKFGHFCFGVFMFICCIVVILSCLWITDIYIGVFLQLTPPPPIPLDNLRGPKPKYQNKNWSTSRPEQLFHENSNLREPLAGSMAYFHFGTEQGGRGSLGNTLFKYEAALLADNYLTYSWRKCFWLST